MGKELTSEDETEMLRKIEGLILDKLLAAHNAWTKSLNYREITGQISPPQPEDIDTAIEDLIAQDWHQCH